MKQIFEKNKETWGVLGAQGVLVNLLMLTLDESVSKFGIKPEWKDKGTMQLEKFKDLMGGMDFNQEIVNKMAEVPNENLVSSEQLQKAMDKVSKS